MKKLRGLFIFILISTFTAVGAGIFKVDIKSVSAQDVNQRNEITATATLPTKYDLRDYISIGVENQNPYGTCYAHASLTSLETYLALTYGEYYDFSEMHFATSLYKQARFYNSIEEALKDGGNFDLFTLYTQKEKSIVLESEMPASKYPNATSSDYANIEKDYDTVNNNFYSIVKVNDTVKFPSYTGNKSKYSSSELTTFRNSIKSHIQQYGSVTSGIHTSSASFTNSTRYLKVTNDSLVIDETTIRNSVNHLISIVGWDDTYNANGAWSNPGAYLCLNSWGTQFGDNGYFYVSYDDYFIEHTINGIVSATLASTNDKISVIANNPNNTQLISHSYSGNLPTTYLANIIDVSKSKNCNITYIDSFIWGGNSKFYIGFYDSYNSALANINTLSVLDLKSSTLKNSFSYYNRYQFSSPISISNDYALIITETPNTQTIHSLISETKYGVSLSPTYCNYDHLARFKTDETWNPEISGKTCTITVPITLHTDKTYVEAKAINGNLDSLIDAKYIQNNVIVFNETITIELLNSNLTQADVSKIKIRKLYANSLADVTNKFNISLNGSTKVNITMTSYLDSTFTTGEYIIYIPLDSTSIYRVVEIQDAITYPITYYLDGGTATNPKWYTNEHTSLSLSSPVKPGYEFVGWYTNSALTQKFNPNSLPYASLSLYAKYDFATPTIKSKSKNITATYNRDLDVTIQIEAGHVLISSYNTLSYQWYVRKTLTDEYSKIDGATNNSLTLHNVADTGYYACEVSIYISDPNQTSTPCIKTLTVSSENEIYVNIKPFIYDMSKVKWNYTEAISYDTTVHTVELVNLPDGVTAEYTGNSASAIGNYTAHASLVYDNMDGNAVANNIEALNWAIRRAKITVKIHDIASTKPISSEVLSNMYSCDITNEYLPANIVSKQDKIDFIELRYVLQDTLQPNIKIITATTKTFTPDLYEVEIINGKYTVVVYELNSNNIQSTSETGFVVDCVFEATLTTLNDTITEKLNDMHLNTISSYKLSYSYIQENDKVTVFVPFARDVMFNHISVYRIVNDKLVKVDNLKATADGITFTTSEQNAEYVIVTDDLTYTSNTQIIVIISILSGFVLISGYVIVITIKRKRSQYMYY